MKKILSLVLILLSAFLFSACGQNPSQNSHEAETEATTKSAAASPVSDTRISMYRNTVNPRFVLSESGIYCQEKGKNGCYVLYCDLHSDQFVFLCSRPDCLHQDRNCDAYLYEFSVPMGYFENRLYYFRPMDTGLRTDVDGAEHVVAVPSSIWQMDSDGRNKKKLMACYEESENLSRYNGIFFSAGYVEGGFSGVSDQGEVISLRRYGDLKTGRLLGETAASRQLVQEESAVTGMVYGCDGEQIIVIDCSRESNNTQTVFDTLYVWDPAANELTLIGEKPSNVSGWFGIQEGYYVEGSVIKHWDYRTKMSADLFDTGLHGLLQLNVYSDCLVVADGSDPSAGNAAEKTDFWFYNWDFSLLGTCTVEFDKATNERAVVFGETADRILLAVSAGAVKPDYYIEKADFGGEITLHKYYFPEEGIGQ